MGQMLKTGGDLLFRAQRLLSAPYDFAVASFTIEKWTHVVMMSVRFFTRAIVVTIIGFALALVLGQPLTTATVQQVLASPLYLGVVAVLLLQHIRLIMFRLADKTRKE